MTSEMYATEWQRNSNAFSTAGHDRWMNEQLGESPIVIEIGCGAGDSTISLVGMKRKVLAIESNKALADAATLKLKASGIEVEEIELAQLASLSDWTGAAVKLLNIDAFAPELLLNLPQTSFDAILCWLIGSYPEHIGRQLGTPYLKFQGTEPAIYRTNVQRRSYEIGQHCLKPDGIVHTVDRGGIQDWMHKDHMRAETSERQSALAGNTFAISKDDCFLKRLEKGLNQSKIQFFSTGAANTDSPLVLVSSKAKLIA